MQDMTVAPAPAVEIDRARLERDLYAIGEAIVATMTTPRDQLALRAVGIDLRSSILKISRDLAQLPAADLWSMLALVNRELNAVAGVKGPDVLSVAEQQAVDQVRKVLASL